MKHKWVDLRAWIKYCINVFLLPGIIFTNMKNEIVTLFPVWNTCIRYVTFALVHFRERPRVTIACIHEKERIKTRYSSLIQLHAVIAHAEATNKNVIQYRSKKRKYNHSLSSQRDGRWFLCTNVFTVKLQQNVNIRTSARSTVKYPHNF